MNTHALEPASIPAEATERVIERFALGEKKRAEYWLNDAIVGQRWFSHTGQPLMEWSLRDGRAHGPMREWYDSGQLASATAYIDGLEHGTAQQWAEDGTLVGTYAMDHGTGLDLWWQSWQDGTWGLAEARQYSAGDRHGFEWWINADQQGLWRESHFEHGQAHGIQREWNTAGRLRRGYPQYFVNGQRLTKRQYLRATRSDPSLPPFREADNRPERQFPPEVAAALRSTGKRSP